MPAPPRPLLDCHSQYNEVNQPWLTGGSHLGQKQEEEGGGIHLEVAPLVVAHHGAAGGGVVLGMQAVLGTLSVLELLHFIHLRKQVGCSQLRGSWLAKVNLLDLDLLSVTSGSQWDGRQGMDVH